MAIVLSQVPTLVEEIFSPTWQFPLAGIVRPLAEKDVLPGVAVMTGLPKHVVE